MSCSSFVVYIFISCGASQSQLFEANTLNSQCVSGCNCGPRSLEPLCFPENQQQTFFASPCELGCQVSLNSTFQNCGCLDEVESSIEQGYCSVGSSCDSSFAVMMAIMFTVAFLSATTRPANSLIIFRALDPRDKAAAISLITSVSINLSIAFYCNHWSLFMWCCYLKKSWAHFSNFITWINAKYVCYKLQFALNIVGIIWWSIRMLAKCRVFYLIVW